MSMTTPTLSFEELHQLADRLLIEVNKIVATHGDLAINGSDDARINAIGLFDAVQQKVGAATKVLKPLETRLRAAMCTRMIAGDVSLMRTERYTISPNFKAAFRLPEYKTAPDRFRAMHEYFGTPLEHVDRGKIIDPDHGELTSEVLKIDWKGVQQHLNLLQAQGKPLPEWVDQSGVWTVADVRLTKRSKGDDHE